MDITVLTHDQAYILLQKQYRDFRAADAEWNILVKEHGTDTLMPFEEPYNSASKKRKDAETALMGLLDGLFMPRILPPPSPPQG